MGKRERSSTDLQLCTTTMRDLYSQEQINRFFDRAGYGGSKRVHPCCFCDRWILSHGKPSHLQGSLHLEKKYIYYLKARAYLDTVIPHDVSTTVVSFLTGKRSIKKAVR